MKTKKQYSSAEATVAVVNGMMKKHGPVFTSDFEILTTEKPLYAGLCYHLGESKITPLFDSAEKATDFVELCGKYVSAFKDIKVKIVKLTLV